MKEQPQNDYILQDRIGKGGFGSVYKAERKIDNWKYAIKVVPLDVDPQLLNAEIMNLKNCDSRFIVQYKDVYKNEKEIWIIMEYCRCGSLASIIHENNRIKESYIREFLSCALFGLIYLHNINIIHRDIKPANLFLSEDGVIKLGDFGLSAQLESTASFRSAVCGTYLYMAPEVFDGKTTMKSDIWALGITAIELAEGKNPYASLTQYAAIKKITFHDPPTLTSSSWSSDFVDFINQCLQHDINKRASANQLRYHPFVKDAMDRIATYGYSSIIREFTSPKAYNPQYQDSEPNVAVVTELPVKFTTPRSRESIPSNSVYRINDNDSFLNISNEVEHIITGFNVCNDESIKEWAISSLYKLRTLTIGDYSFKNVTNLRIQSLYDLETIRIGEGCFTKCTSLPKQSKDNCFAINYCDKLTSVHINSLAFCEWDQFKITECNGLHDIIIGDNCFVCSSLIMIEYLPALTRIIIGPNSLRSDAEKSSMLIMKNLDVLTELKGGNNCFRYIKEVEIDNIPKMENLQLMKAFEYTEKATFNNAIVFEKEIQRIVQQNKALHEKRRKEKEEQERKEKERQDRLRQEREERLKKEREERERQERERQERERQERERQEQERLKREREERERQEQEQEQNNQLTVINTLNDWKQLNTYVRDLSVASDCCNEKNITTVNLTNYRYLKHIKIADESFMYVNDVKICNLPNLEVIEIGDMSFTEYKKYFGEEDKSFTCSNNPKLTQLIIGCRSFSDFNTCKLEELPSLQKIKIGRINDSSYNFYYADFIVKNLPKLEKIRLGNRSFDNSLHTVFDNLPKLKKIKLGYWALAGVEGNTECSLVMKDLPSLTTFTSIVYSFNHIFLINLENIRNLKTVDLPFSFSDTKRGTIKSNTF